MPGNENVVVTIGADRTPYQQQMQQVVAEAKVYGKQAGEAFGVEGLKGERALHGQIQGFFKDISSGADIGTAAMGRLSESFRLSGVTLVALAAVQFLFSALQKGYEEANKFAGAVKDSLTITGDDSAKSVEQMGEDIAKLKEDAKTTDLAAMSSLEAGATVFIQALEKGQSISETINEDAQEHLDIVKQEHQEQDDLASQSIDQQNQILEMKIAGNEAGAAGLEEEFRVRNEMLKLQKDGDENAIAALKTQIQLTDDLKNKVAGEKDAKDDADLDKKIAEEKKKQNEIGATPEQKLDEANADLAAAQKKADDYAASVAAAKKEATLSEVHGGEISQMATDFETNPDFDKNVRHQEKQNTLDVETARTAQKQAQTEADKTPKGKRPLTPAEIDEKIEKDAAKKKEAADKAAREAQAQADKQAKLKSLTAEQATAKSEFATAQDNAMGAGHPIVSSLRREGFGRTPTAGKDSSQLKAVQASEKHLSDISTQIAQLNAKIGGVA